MKKAIVDFGKVLGPMKPQHCLPYGYRQSGPFVATMQAEMEMEKHVSRMFGPYLGYGKAFHVPYIFRDFAADPADPASYLFTNTDRVMQDAMTVGGPLMYCLSGPRDKTQPRLYCTVPADFEKWADVCLHIIRHYNEGWADGFRHGIGYWEIWNEPDNPAFWDGTAEQYYELYAVTARKIKALDPKLKVGGPSLGLQDEKGLDFAKRFLAFVKENGLPLDFFSWHAVNESVDEVAYRARRLRDMIDESGLGPEVFLTGWTCADEKGDERTRFAHRWDARGTAYGTAVMSVMQGSRMDASAVYALNARDLYGNLLNCHYEVQKPWYGLKAFKALYDLGQQVEAQGYGVFVTAARCGGKGAILVTNYDALTHRCELRFDGFGPCRAEILSLDESRDLEMTREEFYSGDGLLAVQLRGYAAALIRLEAV